MFAFVIINVLRIRMKMCGTILWNAKAEKIQDIENHTKTTVLNQENDIFNPRLYITLHYSKKFYPCARRYKYMCKNGNLHARIKKRLMHRKY